MHNASRLTLDLFCTILQVIEDCERTIELDPSLVKAHFYKGEAQMELNLLDGAVESLKTGQYSC